MLTYRRIPDGVCPTNIVVSPERKVANVVPSFLFCCVDFEDMVSTDLEFEAKLLVILRVGFNCFNSTSSLSELDFSCRMKEIKTVIFMSGTESTE